MTFPPDRIRTARLDLVASTLAHVEIELDAPEQLGAHLGAVVPADWPPGEYDRGAMEYFREQLLRGGATAVGWFGWYAIERAESPAQAVLIGTGGFLGAPDAEGQVEVGYSILPAWRGRGYATEITQAMVDWAFADPRVRSVIAHADENNIPSIKVLERSNFTRLGPEGQSGSIRFERRRAI